MTTSYSNFFVPTVLTTSAATLYTVPATPTNSLLRGGRMRFTNTAAGPITVTAYAVPSGGFAAVGNAFISAKSIAAGDYLDADVPIMPAGAFIQALASSATSITAHMLSGSVFS
tara:strand:- start:5308 stop:5649 length:342 start_codon:yes stop_codon:yes gene_type:complete